MRFAIAGTNISQTGPDVFGEARQSARTVHHTDRPDGLRGPSARTVRASARTVRMDGPQGRAHAPSTRTVGGKTPAFKSGCQAGRLAIAFEFGCAAFAEVPSVAVPGGGDGR